MKWKINKPETGDKERELWFAIWPVKYNGYWHWLEWVAVEFTYLGWKWSYPKVVGVGKKSQMKKLLNK